MGSRKRTWKRVKPPPKSRGVQIEVIETWYSKIRYQYWYFPWIHGFLCLFSDTIVSKVSGFGYCFLGSFVCSWKDVYARRFSLSWWHMKRPNTRKSMDFFVSSPLVCFTWPSYVVCRYKKVLQPREIGFPRVYWPQNSYSKMYPGSNPCLSILTQTNNKQ